jgi:nitrogen regulatory protein P-II 1
MKKIEDIIKPNKLPSVTLTLHRMDDLAGVTITDAKGLGCHRPPKADPSMVQDLIDYARFVRVEVVCTDECVSGIVLAVEQAASTGQPGDRKIFVSEVDQAVRIATGERGVSAISRLSTRPHAD